MIARRFLLCAAALLALGGCGVLSGRARPGPQPVFSRNVQVVAPAWHAGSEWQYSDGYGLRVVRVDGPVTTFQRTDDPNQWVSRRGFLREDAQSATTFRKLLFEDLAPGAGRVLSARRPLTFRREYQAGSVLRTHATTWSVEGEEQVRVPAGVFDCVILMMRTRSLTDDWTGYERWWYSPQAENYVRLEYRYGATPPGSRVLTSYRLAAPAVASGTRN
ncbi:MAG: hypothetical protein JO209_05610 [Acidisphaera sp.]|nr:hypothetical protein [Acidisphaera sp.]